MSIRYLCDICGKEARNGPHDFQTAFSISGVSFPAQVHLYNHNGLQGAYEEAHLCETHRQEFFKTLGKTNK